MLLIGMLDSPYVRRVAISLQLLQLQFEHRPLSVFRTFEQFHAINPVVKAPTLVCDDGTVLMDSSLILEYAQGLAPRSLMPRDPAALKTDLRVIGLGLAACDKSVQFIYEHNLRPPDKQHPPWIARVSAQILAAFTELETEVARRPPVAGAAQLMQAGVTTAIAWHFAQQMLPQLVPAMRFPVLATYCAQAESLAAFRAAPHGDGTCVPVLERV